MGRQKGEGTRTKSRPSSSSLAASLLPTGTAAVGFGGYVGNSRLDSALPIEDVAPKSDVDGEVAQHLKRLGRKDPITKLKALASLSEIFEQKSREDIILIIPQWAFEYKRLLQDYNREVRQAAHETMTNLVITVGRGLAPFLKSLMGPWWVSQFDPVSEVSLSARKSLQDAFPAQERRLDALILCTNEVLMYLADNLKLTPQTMSDKATPLDELEEMHERVISTSLLALATLIDILFGMQLQKLDFEDVASEPKKASKARELAGSSAEKIFSTHNYFLEFLKSQKPAVRSASYSVLGSFIKHIPNAFNDGSKKALSTAVLAFQEKDPTCHAPMWDTILLFSTTFPDSWSIGNIQNTALSRFWNFLRNGCYGSQQISYPKLVLFLDTIPPKTIVGEKFLLNFFQNLWEGRNPQHSTAADRLSFFKAFKECFLWAIHNASRYLIGNDAVYSFRVDFINTILVNLLWRDYLLLVSPKNQGGASSGKCSGSLEENIQSFEGRKIERQNTKYPLNYIQDLGKCIIEVLSDISLMEQELLGTFCTVFQEDCLSIIQQAEHSERPFENVEQIVNFLLQLKQHAMQRGETWPLEFLAIPTLTKAFPFIKSLDSPDAVKLLSVTISLFGPRKIVPRLSGCSEGHSISNLSDAGDDKLESELFLQGFKEIFVPWCLSGTIVHSTNACLELLLALLDDELFAVQWCSIITYACRVDENHNAELGSSDFDHIAVLAILMEKVREEIDKRKMQVDFNQRQGSNPEHWHHKLLDSTAISVARCCLPVLNSYSHFLRAVLGGLTENDQTFLVSKDSMVFIFEVLLEKFVPLLNESSFTWAKNACSLILPPASKDSTLICTSKDTILEMAKFSLEVLEGSFFCLRNFDEDSELIPCISAAIFTSDWERRMSQVAAVDSAVISDKIDDGKSRENHNAFVESVCVLRSRISTQFLKGISRERLRKLGNYLIQIIRSAVFEIGTVNEDIVPSLCCQWMVEVLESVGCDNDEEQVLLDQLLDEGKCWPLWVVPPLNDVTRSATLRTETTSTEIHAPEHCQFVAFVNDLISELGFSRVIAGFISQTINPSSSVEELHVLSSPHSYKRPWLAAEILCTWKWRGGCALNSFIPFVSEFAKRGMPLEETLLDDVIDILLNGALVCGVSDELCFLNVWAASDDEIESIQDPFLRALVCLLSTLIIRDKTWGRKKAATLFDHLVGTLFAGMVVNRNCLKILPYVLNVIIQPLRHTSSVPDKANESDPLDSYDGNQLHSIIIDWLQKAVSLPPLTSWKPGQDFEDWVQVIISCYPLDAICGISALNTALERDISTREKPLLLELFRKQQADVDAFTAANQSPSVQMTLSKLTAISVGYCWKEFDEGDWEFVLSLVRRCTESAVVVLEEITENVEEIIVNNHASYNWDSNTQKLEEVAQIADASLMNIARDALYIFSMFCGIIESKKEEEAEILKMLRMEKWRNIKDRILDRVLRLFFATGVAEAIARSAHKEASIVVASSRLVYPRFWELVASSVINSPQHVRNAAVQSVRLWEQSKGPISSLYAILFSPLPVSSLQLAAFVTLSTEPVSHISLIKGDPACFLAEDNIADREFDQSRLLDSSLEESVHLREEISCMIEKSPSELLEMDHLAHERVNVFIAWALLLLNLQSLPPASPTKQRLIQYIQDSANSNILDCLFEHIPLKSVTHGLKKKDLELPGEVSQAANAAKRAISTGSLLFSVESLWPVGTEKMASLAGAVYGLMLRALPAYVRDWFTSVRDRAASTAIESFTRTWCSPSLLADELSQIKMASVADENFSVSVSKSAYEVVATYKKEETGMDLVITFPVSYPLRPVDVDCTRSLGISDLKQRKWLMSMLAFVRSQNGALAEAMRTWKRNFDKEFEGVEECPICYSIIHTNNNSLPRLACKTCKHKFHKACLFKWFHTSHKSTCPLCQSPF